MDDRKEDLTKPVEDAPGQSEDAKTEPGKSEDAPGHNKATTKPVEPAEGTAEQLPAGETAETTEPASGPSGEPGVS